MKNEGNMSIVNNLEIREKENLIIISINAKIYPLSVVFLAAYSFLDRAYVTINSKHEDEIFVALRTMAEGDQPEFLGREFNNEIINQAFFLMNSEKTLWLREEIIYDAFK